MRLFAKQLLPAVAAMLAICGGCGGEDMLDESFNIVNESRYELQLSYRINAAELDASDSTNYTEAGEFIADLTFTKRILPGQTLTFYTLTMQQHATWHATGPAEPNELFTHITVTAVVDNQALSQPLVPTFTYYQEDFITPEARDSKISQSDYEYTATISDELIKPID